MNSTSKIKVIFFDLGETLVSGSRSWMTGARALLSELQSRGIGLGIISNTGSYSRNRVSDFLPIDFDFNAFRPELVLLSSEVGFEKPDIRIFEEAQRRAGIAAEACLFCTEELSHTLAAQGAGMRTVRVGVPGSGLPDLIPALNAAGLLE